MEKNTIMKEELLAMLTDAEREPAVKAPGPPHQDYVSQFAKL